VGDSIDSIGIDTTDGIDITDITDLWCCAGRLDASARQLAGSHTRDVITEILRIQTNMDAKGTVRACCVNLAD
jgi:hypothetical protein